MGNFKTYARDSLPPILIIFGGLPGTGKTTIARELSTQLGATYVRVDSIEQAIRDFGIVGQTINDAGYRVAYVIAEDNLRLARAVISDSVKSHSFESRCVDQRCESGARTLCGS